jgi:hypothetical protein
LVQPQQQGQGRVQQQQQQQGQVPLLRQGLVEWGCSCLGSPSSCCQCHSPLLLLMIRCKLQGV